MSLAALLRGIMITHFLKLQWEFYFTYYNRTSRGFSEIHYNYILVHKLEFIQRKKVRGSAFLIERDWEIRLGAHEGRYKIRDVCER